MLLCMSLHHKNKSAARKEALWYKQQTFCSEDTEGVMPKTTSLAICSARAAAPHQQRTSESRKVEREREAIHTHHTQSLLHSNSTHQKTSELDSIAAWLVGRHTNRTMNTQRLVITRPAQFGKCQAAVVGMVVWLAVALLCCCCCGCCGGVVEAFVGPDTAQEFSSKLKQDISRTTREAFTVCTCVYACMRECVSM